MKKIFLLVIFIYLNTNVNAQNYLPLPDSNAIWIIDQDDGGPGPDFFHKLLTSPAGNDTIINATSYARLFLDSVFYSQYMGAYRSDTAGKTFFIPPDSSEEFLLMDLSVNPGDTIFNVLYDGMVQPFTLQNATVDSVNYINNGPYILKRVYVQFLIPLEQNVWMEKIGGSRGFFNRTEGLSYTFLNCMSFGDTTYYYSDFPWPPNDPIYVSGTCDYPTGILNPTHSQAIVIHPNPTSGKVKIKTGKLYTPPVTSYITVYDSMGLIVLQKPAAKEEDKEIDLSEQRKGVYLIKITNGAELITRKVVLE